jgi:hypothetical protein
METTVKGHYSYNGISGKRFWVPEHKMEVNERIHERHLKKLHEEAEVLEEMSKGRKRRKVRV